MTKILMTVLMSVLSLSSFAQEKMHIEQEAQAVASILQREGRYLSQSQRSEIAKNLLNIRRIILNGDSGRDQDQGEYQCVSRDNDGMNPYVIGYRDGVNITRIQGEQYPNIAECKASLASTRRLSGVTLMCVSKDRDGMNPFQLARFSGSDFSRIERTVTKTKNECLSFLQSLTPRRGQVLFCTSRDNDGMNPYVAVGLNLRSGALQVGTEVFTKKESCQRFLADENLR